MTEGMMLAKAASGLVGTPFRARGRDPQTGLDCVGLVVVSLAQIGRVPPLVPRYTMRNLAFSQLTALLPDAGFLPCREPQEPGDLLLLRPSAAQYHLAVVGPDRALLHAHAGLQAVVSSPAPLPWPIAGQWRLQPN